MEKESLYNNKLPKKEIFGSFDYIDISDSINKLDSINYHLYQKWFFKNSINKFQFNNFLSSFFKQKNINPWDIIKIKSENNKIFLKLKYNKEISFSYLNFQNYLLSWILKNEKKEDIEKKIKSINKAIESLFDENNWFFYNKTLDKNDRINEEIIKKYNIDKNLKWKNLKELKQLLEIENKKLYKVYEITWETDKKKELLKKEISFFASVWDRYEWATKIISISQQEINQKVNEIAKEMSNQELLDYIKYINKEIDSNWKYSELTKQVNLKLVHALYKYAFESFKRQNLENKFFIKLIKVITWRWKLELDKNENYKNKQEFDYKSLDMKEEFKDTILANNILLYVMYKKWWLLEKINKQKKDLDVEDDELEWKTPTKMINDSILFFDKIWWKKIKDYWKQVVESIIWNDLLSTKKDYNELSYEEKIKIWVLARIFNKLVLSNNLSELNSPEKIKKLSEELFNKTISDLADKVSDNFSESLWDWNWTSAEDLWLKWTEAEIFELYQDINWNQWLFDWKDENKLWKWAILFWITAAAWLLIMWPILMWWVAAFTFQAWLLAWAEIGAVSWISEQLLSDKWYDSFWEWVVDISSQISIQIILSALFTATWLQTLKKLNLWFNPDLLFSMEAWFTKAWWIDKSFIVWETWATIYATNYAHKKVQETWKENYYNTDKKNKTNKYLTF